MSLRTVVLGMVVTLLLAGPLTDSLQADGDGARPTQQQNRLLSQGYSQLYQMLSGMRHLNKANYLKVESDKVEAMNKAIAEASGAVADQLEKMADDYPSLSIEDPGLPEIEKKKRKAIRMDRIKDLAPIVGRTGKDYERTILVTEAGLVNSVRFLAEVIKEEEKDAKRAAMMARTKEQFDDLFNRVLKLLDKDYFCS